MTYRVHKREELAPQIFLWEVNAPALARAARPGQFVMVRLREGGERIPLTLADWTRETITLVVKVVGRSTEEMSTYREGDSFLDLMGPLGQPTHLDPYPHVVCVGGGLGIAPLLPIIRGFRELGSRLTTILGFRNSREIFWIDKFRNASNRLILMTEDGSAGEQGTTVTGLNKLLAEEDPVDQLLTAGPLGMMEAIAETTRPWEIPTLASMNPIMVDGIGMCGSCRVRVGDKILFACVDGPDMDAHRIDFGELKGRQRRFEAEERGALVRYHEVCEREQMR